MLEDILLPDTPESVAEAYGRLAERARTEEFGLLEEDVVVLDTETTGLSFSHCQLTEIAAARLSGRTVTERFRTFVNPGMPIPENIVALTHITDADVADAPSPEEAVAALADFVGGAPVLAHNATFDRTFVERVPGGREVSDMWVDTLALSRIALPRLKTHRLQDMAEAFGCTGVSHRAMDDVEALAGMWRVILCGLSDLPAGLLELLANMHPEVEWAYRPILSHLAMANPGVPFSLIGVRRDLVGGMRPAVRPDVEDMDGAPRSPSADEVAAAFGPDGAVSRMYEQYEPRPQQAQMAEQVRQALASSTMCAIEAGTGVGKSVAYLLPLALYAKANGITCGVATKTNALTDQLVSHELPALSKVLPGGVSYACLKGYDHYPCLRRLSRATQAELPVDEVRANGRSEATVASDMLTAIATTYAYVCQSVEGDLDALGIRWASVPRRLLTVTSGECQRSRCPFFPNLCLLHGARRRAGAADVVVTNHSLLLRNVDADGKILPPIRNWVVDEAHSFESEARRQWALELSAERARTTFEAIGGTQSGVIHAFSSLAAEREGAAPALGLLAKAASTAQRTSIASADFFDEVRGLTEIARGGGGYDTVTVWLGPDARETEQWARVREVGSTLVERLDACKHDLDAAQDACEKAIEGLPADLADASRQVGDMAKACRVIVGGEDDTYVCSAEVSRAKRRIGTERLVAEKLDIGSELANRWYPEMRSVTFCSATMTVGGSFAHFDEATGLSLLSESSRRELALSSCYDFDENMSVVVARDIPDPREPGYLERLEDLLYDVHVAMGGSVLTLFTNRREMELVFAALEPRLAAAGLELAMQERGSSARRLRERFIEERELSLMALKSFWEGFDAAGDTLRCVVIPKLPFASPRDPLVQERSARDRQAWRRWSLPEAVLAVKQAAGRLIRTSSDTGVLVLADSRLTTKGYGKVFLRSLPSASVSSLGTDTVGRYLEAWRKGHEGR